MILLFFLLCSSNKTVKKSTDSDIHCDFSFADFILSYEWSKILSMVQKSWIFIELCQDDFKEK